MIDSFMHPRTVSDKFSLLTLENSFYVDDGLTGADSIEGAIDLYVQLQALFNKVEVLR